MGSWVRAGSLFRVTQFSLFYKRKGHHDGGRIHLGWGLMPVTQAQEIVHQALEGAQTPPGDPRVAFFGYWPCRDSGFGSNPLWISCCYTRQVLGRRGKNTGKDWSWKTEGFGVRPGHGFRLIHVLAFWTGNPCCLSFFTCKMGFQTIQWDNMCTQADCHCSINISAHVCPWMLIRSQSVCPPAALQLKAPPRCL